MDWSKIYEWADDWMVFANDEGHGEIPVHAPDDFQEWGYDAKFNIEDLRAAVWENGGQGLEDIVTKIAQKAFAEGAYFGLASCVAAALSPYKAHGLFCVLSSAELDGETRRYVDALKAVSRAEDEVRNPPADGEQ